MRERPNAAPSKDSGPPGSYVDGSGVALHIDVKAFDFHVTAPLHHTPRQLAGVLAQAARWGLEPLDPDNEADAEFLDDDTLLIWLAPTVPEQPWLAEAARRADHALINHLEVVVS